MLPIKSILDEFIFRIKIVKNGICIGLVTGSEDHDLKVFAGFLKTFLPVRSYIDASKDYILWVLA